MRGKGGKWGSVQVSGDSESGGLMMADRSVSHLLT